MFIDLHMHEKTCSKDSFLSLAEMVELAKKRGPGGSDCHYPDQVGVYATYFPGNITSVEELVRAIVNHECRPAFHQDFSYFIWDLDNLLL